MPVPILCVDCREKPATVFLSQIVNGAMTQRNLCAECAAPFFDNPPAAPPFAFLSPASVNPDFLARPAHCPSEVALPDAIALQDLAALLHAKPFQIVAVLVTQNVFISGKEPLDFSTASMACRHYGVKVRKAEEPTGAV